MAELERRDYCVVIPTSRSARQAWKYAWQHVRVDAKCLHTFQIVQPTQVTAHPHLFFGDVIAYRFIFEVLQTRIDDGWIEP